MSIADAVRSMAPNAYRVQLRNREVDAGVRADLLQYGLNNGEGAAKTALKELIVSNDKLSGLSEMMEELENSPLQPEYCLRKYGNTAVVTNGDREAHIPCNPDVLKDVKSGERVLVFFKGGQPITVVRKDDYNVAAGCVATVQKMLNDGTQAVIESRGQQVIYHLKDELIGHVKAGDKVATDEGAKMVISVLEKKDDGQALLTDISILDGIDLESLCDINPSIEEILFRCEAFVRHPDFMRKLGIRPAASYLFAGPTGTGKTTALNIIARRLADHVESLSGKRVSRLVRADTATFFSSYFGETEARIKSWFNSLRILGADKLYNKDGEEIKVPLLIVLEEGEALFRSRGDQDASAHLFDRPLALMLSEASSLGQELDMPVITVMTSNRPSLMDAAAIRRFGMRRVTFGGLTSQQAEQVITKRVGTAPVRENRKADHVSFIVEYLYGEEPDQKIAKVKFSDGSSRFIERQSLVTPAILEECVSMSLDQCLRDSVEAGKMLGVSAEDTVKSLDTHFRHMAQSLRPKSVEEHLPHWFSEQSAQASHVECLV